MWWFVGLFVIAFVAAVVFAPKPPQQEPATLDEIDVPSAKEGDKIGVIFGTVIVSSPNVLWYGDLRVEEEEISGGK